MANCAVIGLGKLGACLAAVLSDAGHTVCGVDINPTTVELLNAGRAPVLEPGLQELLDRAPFGCTTRYPEALIGADIAFIVLPTPSTDDDRFDDTLVRQAVDRVAAEIYHTGPTVVVICSTVMPGTCADIAKSLPSEMQLVYSPEFIALGSVIRDMKNPDLVLIGTEEEDGEYGSFIASSVLEKVWESTPQVAEMPWTDAEIAKLAVNAYVTMKISFANSLAAICEGYPGASALRVSRAIGADSRIGKKYLAPGTSFGGPCFPRDSRAYRAAARDAGTDAGLALETDMENTRTLLRSLEWCPPKGPIAILGMTYKANSHVTEESAGMRLAESLLHKGHQVYTYDPSDKHAGAMVMMIGDQRTIPLAHLDDANQCAAVCVMTPWDEFATFDARVPTRDCWGIVPKNEFVKRVGEGE